MKHIYTNYWYNYSLGLLLIFNGWKSLKLVQILIYQVLINTHTLSARDVTYISKVKVKAGLCFKVVHDCMCVAKIIIIMYTLNFINFVTKAKFNRHN